MFMLYVFSIHIIQALRGFGLCYNRQYISSYPFDVLQDECGQNACFKQLKQLLLTNFLGLL